MKLICICTIDDWIFNAEMWTLYVGTEIVILQWNVSVNYPEFSFEHYFPKCTDNHHVFFSWHQQTVNLSLKPWTSLKTPGNCVNMSTAWWRSWLPKLGYSNWSTGLEVYLSVCLDVNLCNWEKLRQIKNYSYNTMITRDDKTLIHQF